MYGFGLFWQASMGIVSNWLEVFLPSVLVCGLFFYEIEGGRLGKFCYAVWESFYLLELLEILAFRWSMPHWHFYSLYWLNVAVHIYWKLLNWIIQICLIFSSISLLYFILVFCIFVNNLVVLFKVYNYLGNEVQKCFGPNFIWFWFLNLFRKYFATSAQSDVNSL